MSVSSNCHRTPRLSFCPQYGKDSLRKDAEISSARAYGRIRPGQRRRRPAFAGGTADKLGRGFRTDGAGGMRARAVALRGIQENFRTPKIPDCSPALDGFDLVRRCHSMRERGLVSPRKAGGFCGGIGGATE